MLTLRHVATHHSRLKKLPNKSQVKQVILHFNKKINFLVHKMSSLIKRKISCSDTEDILKLLKLIDAIIYNLTIRRQTCYFTM